MSAIDDIANQANEDFCRNPEHIAQFLILWDRMIDLEKKNGSIDDQFQGRMRFYAAKDIERGRIRDNSERYVTGRISNLEKMIKARENAVRLGKTTPPDAPG